MLYRVPPPRKLQLAELFFCYNKVLLKLHFVSLWIIVIVELTILVNGKSVDDKILIPALVSVAVTILTAFFAFGRERHQRLISLHGEAYKAVVAWSEMVYRIRRREKGDEARRKLVERFHDIQEQMDYHKGWISVESLWLGRSYDNFVREVKHKTAPHIKAAWEGEVRVSQNCPEDEIHPDIENECKSFLFDVRCQMAPKLLIIPYLILILKNVYSRKK